MQRFQIGRRITVTHQQMPHFVPLTIGLAIRRYFLRQSQQN